MVEIAYARRRDGVGADSSGAGEDCVRELEVS